MFILPHRLEFAIDGLPPLQHTRRKHWSQIRRTDKEWKRLVKLMLLARQRPAEPLDVAQVICTRESVKEPDYDNLVISFKPLIDGLVWAKLLADDKPGNFVGGQPIYRWLKAPSRKAQRVVIQVGWAMEEVS